MSNKRQSIVEALQTILQGIDGTGSYETTVQTVVLGPVDINAKRGADMPLLEVYGGPELNKGDTMPRRIHSALEVHVIGVQKVATDAEKETEANKLIADVKRAIYADRQLGLGHTYVLDAYVRTATPIESEVTSIVITAMEIVVQYTHTTEAADI